MSPNATDLVIETGVDKERSREHPTHYRDSGRWALHSLQRGRLEGRADAPPAPRTALVFADLRAALRATERPVSPRRSRLPRLRAQRLAGSEELRVHVRPLRRDPESLRRSARSLPLHALHAGLRRSGGISHGVGSSGPGRGAHSSRTPCRTMKGWSELEASPGLPGRSRCQRKHTSREPSVARDDADRPRR